MQTTRGYRDSFFSTMVKDIAGNQKKIARIRPGKRDDLLHAVHQIFHPDIEPRARIRNDSSVYRLPFIDMYIRDMDNLQRVTSSIQKQ